MIDNFPYEKFPYLEQYESSHFVYDIKTCNFQEVLVKAQLKYCPGVYMIYDFSNNILGKNLYVGESGVKNARIVEQQLPIRILNATCYLPDAYPACDNKRELKRAKAWKHMMFCDNISKIIFFIFYTPLVEINNILTCSPTPTSLQNQIFQTFYESGQKSFQWSTKSIRDY